MKLTIDVENIRRGDKIRLERDKVIVGSPLAIEYEARRDGDNWGYTSNHGLEYFLLERPVVLPTEPGWYESDTYPLSKGCAPYHLTEGGDWFVGASTAVSPEIAAHVLPLRKLGTERDIANKVLDELSSEYDSGFITTTSMIANARNKYNQ